MKQTLIPSTEPESSPGEGCDSPVEEQSSSNEVVAEPILVAEDLQHEPSIEKEDNEEEAQIAQDSQPEVESAPAEGK